MAKIIKDKRFDKIQDIYNAALDNKFGCKECLVVMDKDNIIFKGDEYVGPLYREKFDDSSFNPRWKNGTADYVVILKTEDYIRDTHIMKFEIKSDHNSIEIDSKIPILTDNLKINHIQVEKVYGDKPEENCEKVIINIIEPKDFRIEQVKIKGSKFEYIKIIPM